MSLFDITAEDYVVLSWLYNIQSNPKDFVRVVDVDLRTGEVSFAHEPPPNLGLTGLFKVLSRLEERGLVKSLLDRKMSKCGKCGRTLFQIHLNCVVCGGEEISVVKVFQHSCGANLTDHLVSKISSCPKCGDGLKTSDLSYSGLRFACDSCGSVFENPVTRTECLACGELRPATELVFENYRKYKLTDSGYLILEARSPQRLLVKKLLEEGFHVYEKVQLKGISGAQHSVDVLAVGLSETRVYQLSYFVDADVLLKFAVKRLDVEKTQIPGAVGKVRWIMAGVEFAEQARKTSETFGLELEMVKFD